METLTRDKDASAFAPDGALVAPPCAMVIFGAAGDLTKRLVVPALYNLVKAGRLPFLSEMLPKIERLRTIWALRGVHPIIQVDGGENRTTAAQAAAAGATAIVAGSAIFGAKDYAGAIAAIRAHATEAAAQA
jgi:hypothetical protein